MRWLEWVKQIQAISQTGLAYAKDEYDVERYEELRSLSAAMMSHISDTPVEKVKELFAGEGGYATPKVDVRAVIFHEEKLLLVREKSDGAWSLPGGWADIGYTPSEIAVKETREEAGYEVKPIRLLALLDKKCHEHPPTPWYTYKVFIQCEIVGGTALQSSLETSDVRFFGERELPNLSVERNTIGQVQRMFKFLQSPEAPTMFD